MKKSTQINLRLSAQAHKHLSEITAITGMTKTAAVEYSLALMRTNLYQSNSAKEIEMTNTIVNEYGYEMDYDAAVNMMDDDLREAIHNSITESMTPQQFFNAYCKAHLDKYGEVFELAKPNPVW